MKRRSTAGRVVRLDAPSRGHDLKRLKEQKIGGDREDAPSRGHDLKRHRKNRRFPVR